MDAYTLKKKIDTEELHLFKGEMTLPTGCNSSYSSICKKMDKSEAEKVNVFTCHDENTARIEAAKIGRKVCGTCVSHLYSTTD